MYVFILMYFGTGRRRGDVHYAKHALGVEVY